MTQQSSFGSGDRVLAGDWQNNMGNRLDQGQSATQFSDLAKAISQQWGEPDQEEPGKRKQLEYIYWRKCMRELCFRHSDKNSGVNLERGWIVIGPSEASDPRAHDRFIRSKHMEPLQQYGAYPVGEASLITSPRTRFVDLMNRGGIMEFPREQMIAYNWDKIALLRQFRPDIDGVSRIPCPYCSGRDFIDNYAMREHSKVMHESMMVQEATASTLRDAILLLGDKMQPQALDPAVLATAMAMAVAMNEARQAGQSLTPEQLATQMQNSPRPRSGKNAQAQAEPPPPNPSNVDASVRISNFDPDSLPVASAP